MKWKFFLTIREKNYMVLFTDETFQLSLAYLVDVFEANNNLSLKLQGRNINIIATTMPSELSWRKFSSGSTNFMLVTFRCSLCQQTHS
jgi:hypothetical protein